ncbi:MAG: ABC transporter permease [Acidobacteriota bacterium]|nr:ABC transporter permease [Acidobacteriota bacterium]
MNSLLPDIRYALLGMRRSPAFFGLIVGILGLGIAASLSVFGIVDGVLLRSLPYRDPARLVRLLAVPTRPPFESNGSISFADYEQIQKRSHSYEDLAITYRSGWSTVTLAGDSEPEKAQGAFVSPNLFSMFGRSPIAGRLFTPEENRQAEKLVVLSEGLATRRFGSPAASIGRDLDMGDAKWRVIGVMPADFRVPFLNVQLWAPIFSYSRWMDRPQPAPSPSEPEPRQLQRWDVYARLQDGVSLRAAQNEIEGLYAQLTAALPQAHEHGNTVHVVPLLDYFTSGIQKALWVLLGAVAFLLLITCANVANLLLARASTRSRELAVRAALGATSARLLRQVAIETITLCFISGIAGVLASFALIRALKAFAPPGIPRLDQVQIDARLLLVALALTLLIGTVLGVVTAWRAARREPRESLGASGRAVTENRHSRRVKSLLVASEFALAMVLLTGSALLIRSFVAILNVNLGFRPEHVLTVHVDNPHPGQDFYSRAVEAVSRIPGVQAAGSVATLFYLDETRMHALRLVEGHAPEPVAAWKPLVWTQVSGAYFQAMSIPLLRGRYFNDRDSVDASPPLIVNETLARRYWPGEDPIGKRVKGFDARGKNDDFLTVVGVVGDTRSGGLERQPFAQIYELPERSRPSINIVIRAAGDPVQIAGAARSVIRQISSVATISSVNTMEQLLDSQTMQRRFQTWLIAIFSAIALALAALGVFAVMHYSVAAKTHEIGIRMAIGARAGDILRMVLGDGARLALAGIAAGALAGAWTTEAVAGMLYGVERTDPASFALAAIALAGVGLAACYFPARRAMRVDPVRALRE